MFLDNENNDDRYVNNTLANQEIVYVNNTLANQEIVFEKKQCL